MSDVLLEILVQAAPSDDPRAAARGWVQRLSLKDGAKIRVVGHHGSLARHPRHYVAWKGDVVNTRQYRVQCAMEPLADLLREVGRPMSAADVLDLAHAKGMTTLDVGLMGIEAAAQLLVRTGRARKGEIARTWYIPAETQQEMVPTMRRRVGG